MTMLFFTGIALSQLDAQSSCTPNPSCCVTNPTCCSTKTAATKVNATNAKQTSTCTPEQMKNCTPEQMKTCTVTTASNSNRKATNKTSTPATAKVVATREQEQYYCYRQFHMIHPEFFLKRKDSGFFFTSKRFQKVGQELNVWFLNKDCLKRLKFAQQLTNYVMSTPHL